MPPGDARVTTRAATWRRLPCPPVIFDPPTRTRRRWSRLIWPALIAAAVTLAVVVSSAGEETRTELEYLEQIQSQSSKLARSGDALRDVVSRLQRIDRTEFVTVIDGINDDLAEGLTLTDEQPPIVSLVSVHALYRETLETWSDGVSLFATAILTAADEPENTIVVDEVAAALSEIRAGDRSYARMVEAMARDDVPEPLSPMPSVTLMPADARILSLAAAYVDSARSENSALALRPGLRVSQLLAAPEWQENPDGLIVMPSTTEVTFSVVISNTGNIRSAAIPLVLEMIGGAEPVRLTNEVPELDPTQQVTVIFDPLAVEPGGIYQVSASLVVTGNDTSFEDNEISVEFTVNEQ